MYKPLPEIQKTLEELEVRLKRERNPQLRPRLHLLVLMRSGRVQRRAEAALHLAVHRNTIGRWVAAYEEGGLPALLHIEKTGAKPGQRSLPEAALNELREKLDAEGFDGYTDVQRWLAEAWGLEVRYATLHRLVRYGLRAKLKRARPQHAKKTRTAKRTVVV